MKHLLTILTVMLFVVNANAVTSTKKSTKKAKAKTSIATPNDAALAAQLAKEVEAEEAAAAKTAKKKPAAPVSMPLVEQQVTGQPINEQQALEQPMASNQMLSDDQAISNEMAAADAQTTTQVESTSRRTENNMYLLGSVGVGGYPDVSNITGRYSGTIALGYMYDQAFMFELGGTVAQYKMDALNPTVLNRIDRYDIDQFGLHIAAKYRMIFGKISPNAGIMLASTQRRFTQLDPNNSGNNGITVDRGSTQTTDAGLIGGVDFEINKEFAIGLDFKYMMNLSNNAQTVPNVNANSQNSSAVTPIEKLESYTAGISARMNF